jgi:hypothetical protein
LLERGYKVGSRPFISLLPPIYILYNLATGW